MSKNHGPLAWVAGGPGRRLEHIRALKAGPDEPHDMDECLKIAANPDMHCGDTATITAASVDASGRLHIEWRSTPYCRGRSAPEAGEGMRAASFGWNVVLTLEGGTRAVVMRRSERTVMGGMWSVSANETVCPDDMPDTGDWQDMDVTQVTRRSVAEELGVIAPHPLIEASSSLVGVFAVDGSYGALVVVDGDAHGLAARDLKKLQAAAQGAWEGSIEVMEMKHIHNDRRRWVPWALQCFEEASAHALQARTASVADDDTEGEHTRKHHIRSSRT